MIAWELPGSCQAIPRHEKSIKSHEKGMKKEETAMELPHDFQETVRNVHGGDGRRWIEEFDGLIRHCEERWGCRVLKPFSLSYNFVAPVLFGDGSEGVVKLCVPGIEVRNEVTALAHFNRRSGMVEMKDYDLEKGIILLERISPGTSLSAVEDDRETTMTAAGVLRNLWTDPPEEANLPTTEDREENFHRQIRKYPDGTDGFSKEILLEAAGMFRWLNETSLNKQLLHGDFHHFNVLSAEKGNWIAIDPKGLIGEVEYDLIQYMLNCLPETGMLPVISQRVSIFAEELSLQRDRILKWGFCHSVLAALWCMEDGSGCEQKPIQAAGVFRQLLSKMDADQ